MTWFVFQYSLFSKNIEFLFRTGDVYLLGATNMGKSSLFHSLIDSDLCHIHALDCIQRATTSNLPGEKRIEKSVWEYSRFYSGTTMNVLRFPTQLRSEKNQFMSAERLKERWMTLKRSLSKMKQQASVGFATNWKRRLIREKNSSLENNESTMKWRHKLESAMNLPKSGASYTYSCGKGLFDNDCSFLSCEHHYIKHR